MFKTEYAALFVGLFLLAATDAYAEREGRGERPGHGKPPQAAFDACASSSLNAACQVQTPDGEQLAGLCLTPPRQQQLVCVPDLHRQQRADRDAAGESFGPPAARD